MVPRSPFDPDTKYVLEKSDTPVTVDGFAKGEPTGEITCAHCGRTAKNVDEIPHSKCCDQRWVRTDWWAKHFTQA